MDESQLSVTPARVQSPSSIKTYKQCPRKYYYQYIEKLKTAPNIHTTRGNIVHDALEQFFDFKPSGFTENYAAILKQKVQELLLKNWVAYEKELARYDLTREQKIFYFEESMHMLFNWLGGFLQKIEATGLPFPEAFCKLSPVEREKQYRSTTWSVRGFIDIVEDIDGKIRVMDYKTSKNQSIEEHRLQLAIYALLYQDKHGRLPDEVGIYFLKGKERSLKVDDALMEYAKRVMRVIHEKTQSKNKQDYPLKITRLCKWSTGQCDFLDVCTKEWPEDELLQIKGGRNGA